MSDGLADEEEDRLETESHPVQISDEIRSAFTNHTNHLKESRRKRRKALNVTSIVGDPNTSESAMVVSGTTSFQEQSAGFGEAISSDVYEGDSVTRTLYKLLSMVDDRGFARSPQQCLFHDAFIRACSRVMYRNDWSMNKPAIMKHNNWVECPSQILVSTPRRFGKTFRYASGGL